MNIFVLGADMHATQLLLQPFPAQNAQKLKMSSAVRCTHFTEICFYLLRFCTESSAQVNSFPLHMLWVQSRVCQGKQLTQSQFDQQRAKQCTDWSP